MRSIDFYASNEGLCVQSKENGIFLYILKLGLGTLTFIHVRDLRPLGLLGPFRALSLEISESCSQFLKTSEEQL